MPKTFSDNERALIKQKLLREAEQCLAQFGVKKTTVDEIVKRVNIPKGTFYLFYASKELLFFDVFCVFHDEVQKKLLAEIGGMKDKLDPESLTGLIFGLYKMVEGSFLLRLMTNGEMELLIRKLPPEIAVRHAEQDDFSVEQLVNLVPNMGSKHIRAYSGALRGIFVSMLHKHEIGDDIFDEALKIMIRGIALQMFHPDQFE